jgi:hypothetical protein
MCNKAYRAGVISPNRYQNATSEKSGRKAYQRLKSRREQLPLI